MTKNNTSYLEFKKKATIIKHDNQNQLSLPITDCNYFAISYLQTNSYYHDGLSMTKLDKPCLFFSLPQAVTTAHLKATFPIGFTYFFNKNDLGINSSLLKHLLNNVSQYPLFPLDEVQSEFVNIIFKKIEENNDFYHPLKHYRLKTLLEILIFKTFNIRPIQAWRTHITAKEMLSQKFINLLEQQFPVTSKRKFDHLMTASFYATKLNVHVNHLNFTIKKVFKISTSQFIMNRVIYESQSLLITTDWSISEIADALGYQTASHFSTMFKKKVGITPGKYKAANKN